MFWKSAKKMVTEGLGESRSSAHGWGIIVGNTEKVLSKAIVDVTHIQCKCGKFRRDLDCHSAEVDVLRCNSSASSQFCML